MAGLFDLSGKVALITGAGRGIGRATALLFAQEGAEVVLVSEVTSEIEAVAKEVRALDRVALPITADLRHEAQIDRMVGTALGKMGRVDVIVCSAGVAIHGEVATLSTEAWDENFAVNVRGMFLVTRALLPQFIERRSGAIVNIASSLGKQGSAMRAAWVRNRRPGRRQLLLTIRTRRCLRPTRRGSPSDRRRWLPSG